MLKYIIYFCILVSLQSKDIDFKNAFLYKNDINSYNAYKKQQNGAILIDVRTIKEFKEARAKGSINIPIFYNKKNKGRVLNTNFIKEVSKLLKHDKTKEVILICRSGSRTKFASNILAHNGFSNVYNVKKGFKYDWIRTNLPIEKRI